MAQRHDGVQVNKCWRYWVLLGMLAGCAAPPDRVSGPSTEPPVQAAPEPVTSGDAWESAVDTLLQTPPGGGQWQPFVLPGKRFAAFEVSERPDVPFLSVRADRSVSILRRQFLPAIEAPGHIDFTWKVDALPQDANLAEADREDAAVRILLSFDGDRSRWSPKNHRLSEMSRLLTGEELPYATLMYVWSNHGEPGSVVVNPRTDRIRKVVVESGKGRLGQWRTYRRDIRADFVKAFGEEPGTLRSVALMTDTDNTRSQLRAWYGPLRLATR
jgi:Protein of unknown function (DUF3047)